MAQIRTKPNAEVESRPIIHKAALYPMQNANLPDYDQAYGEFSWNEALAQLHGLPDGSGLNIAYEAVDYHAAGALADKVALRFLRNGAEPVELTYAQLSRKSNQFANILAGFGLEKGERVFVMAERIPELYVAALGTLKNGNVFCPLFSAFGPEPIKARMEIGDARLLVTTASLYKRKVRQICNELPGLEYILLVPEEGQDIESLLEETDSLHDLHAHMKFTSDEFNIAPTDPEDMALLHFTSGTTGRPKGAVHVHQAVAVHRHSAFCVLDLREDDIYWCTADPGWVTGTSYGIIAPLVLGVTMIVDYGDFDAQRWYEILQEEGVTVWYTAPTAIRMLMKYGTELAQQYDLSRLRHAASVGEPLNPEAVVWGQEAIGLPFHDNWWQTETGGIMVANYPSMDIRPGSMGKPLPGIDAAIVQREGEKLRVIDEVDGEGELALRAGWPSMFRSYLNERERYDKCFADGWYLTGDLARRDADGYYWFVGRADDVIKSSGHLIGPFEVESVLIEHPDVVEAGVIGKPDAVAGEIVKAFIQLKPGVEADEALRRAILGLARKRLGAAVAPKEIEFVESLPRTRSGKIMRRLLKARELGLPEGDTSTLESPS